MRKLCIILMAATPLMIVMAGCSGQVDIPVGGIDSVRVDNVVENYCNSFDPCSYTYWISFQDPEQGDHYYWAELASRTDTAKGKTVEMYNNGWDWHSINVTAYYFEVTPYEYYYVNVYRTNSPLYGGIVAKRTSAGMLLGSPMQMGPFATDCGTRCCTYDYAWALIAKLSPGGSDLDAARCSVYTRYGSKLCGVTPLDTGRCHGAITLDIDHDTTFTDYYGDRQYNVWATIEYSKLRFSYGETGDTTSFRCRITEMQGYYYDWLFDIYGTFPQIGSVHEYRIELNQQNGKWFYWYDNVCFDTSIADPVWQTTLGSAVRWGGEVLGLESDMPGTFSNPCRITECQYRPAGGDYHDANFNLSRGWLKTDTTEWMVKMVDDVSVDVWDVNPLP
jgi:hypothetical protein